MSLNFIPYEPCYDTAIRQLENSVVQGNQVKLTIIKDHFLDRSVVFDKAYPLLVIDEEKHLIATGAGAYTRLVINGEQFTSGFVYDVKVHPAYRNQGIGRMITSYYKKLFTEDGYARNFTTLKLSNTPIVRMSTKVLKNIWLYPFVYLTIPVNQRIEDPFNGSQDSQFSVYLFNQKSLSADYYSMFDEGLGCFYTNKLYRLRIEKISGLLRQGLKIYKTFYPSYYELLPKENQEMSCATLFNHSVNNMNQINKVLDRLREQRIGFLSVCCQRKDAIYSHLKKYSISTYPYYMLFDFPVKPQDHVTIDVRCL